MRRKILSVLSLVIVTNLIINHAYGATFPPKGWIPLPGVSTSVAYQLVPKNKVGPCTWCSPSHGESYWKVNFISNKTCPAFYMNAGIYNQSGTLLKYWYQKGGYQTAHQPFQLEIDTSDPNSTFKIVQVIC